MPFLEYRDNDSGLRPSSYPYMLGRALIQDRIDTSVTICTLKAVFITMRCVDMRIVLTMFTKEPLCQMFTMTLYNVVYNFNIKQQYLQSSPVLKPM